jgi:pyruvate dehydrogenase E1 component alpha subunit
MSLASQQIDVHRLAYQAEFLLGLYRRMVRIRKFEERVKHLFLEGVMPGTIHQCNGQEACAVGVCAALEPADVITSTHRPHGHALAKGITVQEAMAELFARTTGCCKGKGGSMHLGDLAKGVLPAIAIVGAGVPIATGMALAFKMRKERRVAVCFMGDGATNEGAFHEAVNMGAIWDLPVVYVVENNLYGASTPVHSVMRTKTIAERSAAYGIPGVTIDGNDVLAVYETANEAIQRAREGHGPTLLELMTYRVAGHSRRDPALYQPKDEKEAALANEPIGRFARLLVSQAVADGEMLDRIDKEVNLEIEAAVQSAMAAPEPKPEDTLADLFVD